MNLLLLSASAIALQPVPVQEVQDKAEDAATATQREEIVITGHYVEGLDLLAGTSSIDGLELQRDMDVQLGETLAGLPGVSATSFSPGASRPVLRGYQGGRIRVLTDGLGAIDVSNTSADHAVTIDPLTAERIEVLRGPAVLLFGSEAIGGAVNVVTHRLPRSLPAAGEHVDMMIRGSTADDGIGGGLAVDLPVGRQFVLHADGSITRTSDLSVGGHVNAPTLRAELFDLAEEAILEGEPEEAEEALEAANARDLLANSYTRQKTASLGLTWLGDTLELGAAVSLFDTNYGVPMRPGAHHAHGDEEAAGEEEEAPVSIDLLQKRLDLRGRLNLDGWLDQVDVRIGVADYEHTEFEGEEVGTTFLSTGSEGRIEFHQNERSGWGGVFGAQYYQRDFDAIGEEAFVPANKTDQVGLFVRQEYAPGPIGVEAAVRLEKSGVEAVVVDFNREFTTVSGAVGLRYEFDRDTRVGINASRTARAPSAEELLSDGPHVATQSYELGNPDLVEERAWGAELYARHEGPTTAAAVTLWANWFDDFIYNFDSGLLEDDLPVFVTDQQDSDWWGVEVEAASTLVDNGSFVLKGDLVADYIRATLADGSPVPRIPPLRVALGAEAEMGDFDLRLEGEWSAKQDRIAASETETDSHVLVGASIGWRPWGRRNESVILLSANNIFDVDARRHASYTKDFVPMAGRDIRLSGRFSF